MFRYAVETERRFYLANTVDLKVVADGPRPLVELSSHRRLGVGHVPPYPIRAERQGADVQGRQRRGAPEGRALMGRPGGTSRANVARGEYGERRAAAWYEREGYSVVDRNWRDGRGGELDLVLRKGDLVVICEVKARRSDAYGTPAEAVTPTETGQAPPAGGSVALGPSGPWRRRPLRRRRGDGHRDRGLRGRLLSGQNLVEFIGRRSQQA